MSRFDVEKFESLPDPDLVCCICQCVLDGPVESPCRHVFCKICIETWLHKHRNCPTCRRRLRKQNLKPVLPLVQNMLNRLMMFCDYSKNGCDEKIMLEHFEKHTKECEFELIKCKYEKCGVLILRKNIKDHMENICDFREKLCRKQCGLMIVVSEYDSHDCFEELKKYASEKQALAKKLQEKVQELHQLTEKLNSQIADLQQKFTDGRRHALLSSSWSSFSSDSDGSFETTLTDFSINDFSDYNVSDSSSNQAMTFEEFDQQDRSFWRNLQFDSTGNINTRRRSRRINNREGRAESEDNEVEIIDVVNTPPQSPRQTSTLATEVISSPEVFIDVENNSEDDTNYLNNSPAVVMSPRDDAARHHLDNVFSVNAAESDGSTRHSRFHASSDSSENSLQNSHARPCSRGSTIGSHFESNYFSDRSISQSSYCSRSDNCSLQCRPCPSSCSNKSDSSVCSGMSQAIINTLTSPSYSQLIHSCNNNADTDTNTICSSTAIDPRDSNSCSSVNDESRSFGAISRNTSPPLHRYEISSDEESEQNEIENDVLIRNFSPKSDSENEKSCEGIYNSDNSSRSSKSSTCDRKDFSSVNNSLHSPGNVQHTTSVPVSEDPTWQMTSDRMLHISEDETKDDRVDDSESDIIPVHIRRKKKKKVKSKRTESLCSANRHTATYSSASQSNESESKGQKLTSDKNMKLTLKIKSEAYGAIGSPGICSRQGIASVTNKRKSHVIYSSDSSEEFTQSSAKRKCTEKNTHTLLPCTVGQTNSNTACGSHVRQSGDLTQCVEGQGQRKKTTNRSSANDTSHGPVTIIDPLLEHYNSDSDDTWEPDEVPHYSDDTDTEDIQTDSDYDVLVPKSTAQLLEELCSSDESDDSWTPN